MTILFLFQVRARNQNPQIFILYFALPLFCRAHFRFEVSNQTTDDAGVRRHSLHLLLRSPPTLTLRPPHCLLHHHLPKEEEQSLPIQIPSSLPSSSSPSLSSLRQPSTPSAATTTSALPSNSSPPSLPPSSSSTPSSDSSSNSLLSCSSLYPPSISFHRPLRLQPRIPPLLPPAQGPTSVKNRYFDLLFVPIAACFVSTLLQMGMPQPPFRPMAHDIELILQGT